MRVFELLTQSPDTSDCQVTKVFAMKTVSMKAILQRANSFKQINHEESQLCNSF